MKNGRAPAAILCSLLLLYLVWAALHDICRADETDYTLEYSVLALAVFALAFIHRWVFRSLTDKGKLVWLSAAAAIVLLFDLAAISATFRPKYPNDAAVGTAFLAISLPLLGFVCYRTVRVASRG